MLLDLPTELFTFIITDVVHDVGLTEAWRLRGVSKTFKSYIEDEILGNTPLSQFRQADKTFKIVHENLEKFLLKHCLSSPAFLATNPLPLFLVELTDTILSEFPPQDEAQDINKVRYEYLSDLVRLIIKRTTARYGSPKDIVCFDSPWGDAICEWADVNRMSGKANPADPLKLSQLVIAAAAVGNLNAIKYYFGADPEAAFSCLFCGTSQQQPLQSAAIGDKYDMVTVILDHFQSILEAQPQDGLHSRDRSSTYGEVLKVQHTVFEHLDNAIQEAIDQGNSKMLQLLPDFEFQSYDYDSKRVSNVMLAVVESKSFDMLKVIVGFKCKDDEFSEHDDHWWEEACVGGTPQMVRYLLETGIATTRGPEGFYRGYGYETPLHWTAKSGNGDIAKILMKHGADVNYRCRVGRPTPLKTAAYFGNIEVAQILIDAGANVHFEHPLTAIFNCKRRERTRENVIDAIEMLPMTELLLKYGTSITRQVAFAIEQDAKCLVTSGERWVKGDLSPDCITALVSVAKRLMETVPRWRIPYADFYIRSREARDLFDAQSFERRYRSKQGSAPCWPDMYFLSRVLRNVGYGNLRKLIPRKRKYLIGEARMVLCWLEDWRV
jgi:hypothetical protein